MTLQGLLIAGTMLLPSTAPAAQVPPDGQTCTALVMPSVTGAEGNASQIATTVRDLFASYLTGPSMRAVALDARLPSQAVEEARQKKCDRVLLITLTEKHHGRSVLGQAVGQAAGTAAWYIPGGGVTGAVVRGTTAGVASAVSAIASSTHAKDELEIQYTLNTVGGQTLLKKSDKAKAKADREDLLTPLVERAAMAIAALPAK